MAATWLKDAIFYEIYPQAFYDTDGGAARDGGHNWAFWNEYIGKGLAWVLR